ncbi:MAG: helix-turn-helix domain-containing protein [Breznakia sp.]
MYLKTTSFVFRHYGEVFSTITDRVTMPGGRKITQIKNKEITFFYCCPVDVYMRVDSGISIVCVSNTLDSEDFSEQFVIHKIIKINAGVYFNLMTLTSESQVEFQSIYDINDYKISLPGNPIAYKPIVPTLHINEVLACYYQARKPGYKFHGEIHNHWELNFIDNGQIHTTIENREFVLNDYDLILYAPGQYHDSFVDKDKSCSHLTIMFDMDTSYEPLLINEIFHADRELTNLINDFVNASNENIHLNGDRMTLYLNLMIINLLQNKNRPHISVAQTPMQQKFEDDLLNQILIFINENIYSALTIEQLCQEFSVSRSSLQQLFRNNLKSAPKQYISNLKLNKSKLLIKESKYTISEISNILGFASIHYFSRKFKQQFGITPSDYAKTIYN